MLICCLLNFSKSTFSKKYQYHHSVKQFGQHLVGPDLRQNCLQRLSEDETSRQRAKWATYIDGECPVWMLQCVHLLQ